MGSKPSKTPRPAPAKGQTTTVPRIPQDVIDEILDHLAADSGQAFTGSLRSCALVSKSWVPSCRRHLFRTVVFASGDIPRWLRTFPAPEEGPARHVRDLQFSVGIRDSAPKGFFDHTPWFVNVKRVTLLGRGRWMPFVWRLPQSVTSLTLNMEVATLLQVRDITRDLPDLVDLSLSGSVVTVDRGTSSGIGRILVGRFSGKLQLRWGFANKDIMNMLLEIPTGLHFSEVQICATRECLLSTVRIAAACGENLVKLSYTASFARRFRPSHGRADSSARNLETDATPDLDGYEDFERSFDFSKCPNLKEVNLGVGWKCKELSWIPVALSTLRSTTTPHLSVLRLDFSDPLAVAIEGMLGDLRQIADEVTRIEQEFEGAVSFTVVRDPVFKVILHVLNVRF